ncbi:hypothetical protein TI39_contig354g00140 [Zymoseptoria brevis]|uniref:LysM domain-containing protein n=1 Tax=Zymoseptoria brevis TaxID=1047168 RepID=A0A0F4GQP2_9PEZI|nr:hypothetical protein TI39_contig354g00140 [Zymoseptoria brevis]
MQFTALVAALLSVAAVQAQRNPITITPQFDCGATNSQTYIARSGDTLTKIAQEIYHDVVGVCDIAKANNLADPNRIDAGTSYTIPINCQTYDRNSCL